MTLELDEADKAFVESLVPEGGLLTTLFGLVSWVAPDGEMRWNMYVQTDSPISTTLGLLDLAKFRMMTGDEANEDE